MDLWAGRRPDVSVSLKGPVDAPKRTLEVAALTYWLALRAVDQKAKRVDALEQAAREHPDDAGDSSVASPANGPLTGSVGPAGPPRQRPRQDPPAASGGAPPASAGKAGDESRVRRSVPTVQQAPLPPPLDIRPMAPQGPRG